MQPRVMFKQLALLAPAVVMRGLAAWAAPVPPPMGHPHMNVAPAAQALHNQLERLSGGAARSGNYVCCINPPCEFCAVHMAKCPCGKNLAAAKAVCRECKGGWDLAEGRIAGIKPQAVKGMSATEAAAMMQKEMSAAQKPMTTTNVKMP